MTLVGVVMVLAAGALAGPGAGPAAPCSLVAGAAAGELSSFPPCVEVTLEAEATGRPPLGFEWELPGGTVLTGNPAVLDTGLLPVGFHEITLTVSNSAGVAERPVHLVVEGLGFSGEPELVPEGGGSVSLRANTTGATEWRWSFGDGTGTGWLTGCEGFRPSHSFPGPGMYQVTVEARSCREGPVAWTGTLVVAEGEAPGVEGFEVVCPSAPFCSFSVGEVVPFRVEVSGAVEVFVWDWDGDGVEDELSGEVLVEHVYGEAGYFVPRLTVVGAGAEATAVLVAPIEVVGGGSGVLFRDGFESGDLRHWGVP